MHNKLCTVQQSYDGRDNLAEKYFLGQNSHFIHSTFYSVKISVLKFWNLLHMSRILERLRRKSQAAVRKIRRTVEILKHKMSLRRRMKLWKKLQ